jgi:hypothetical protein
MESAATTTTTKMKVTTNITACRTVLVEKTDRRRKLGAVRPASLGVILNSSAL